MTISSTPSAPRALTDSSRPHTDIAAPCPCGTGSHYAACCGRFHQGPLHLSAPDAHLLMRSRYSAFVYKLERYLLDTWHPTTRPSTIDLERDGVRWLGLEVKRFEVQDEDHATVEFVARSKTGGRATRDHQFSRFVRNAGRWFYLDGERR